MCALAESLLRTRAANRYGVPIPLGSSHPCMAIAVVVAMLSLTPICAPHPWLLRSLSVVSLAFSTLGNAVSHFPTLEISRILRPWKCRLAFSTLGNVLISFCTRICRVLFFVWEGGSLPPLLCRCVCAVPVGRRNDCR